MKRICIVILLALTFSLSQLACSTGNQANTNAPSNVFTEKPATSPIPPNNVNVPMPSGSVDPSSSASMELVMAYGQWFSARMGGERAKAEGLIADDYKETTSDGKVLNKSQVLADISPEKKSDTYTLDSLKSTINGDTGTLTGPVTVVRQGHTETWQVNVNLARRQGHWQVVSSKITDYKKT
jgi:hypothetical protein